MGVEIELILALPAAISEIQVDFQNSHIWTWNLAIGQSSRNCTYTLYPLSTPKGVEIELVLALRAAVSEIWADFQKLPYLGMKLGHWPKCPTPYTLYNYVCEQWNHDDNPIEKACILNTTTRKTGYTKRRKERVGNEVRTTTTQCGAKLHIYSLCTLGGQNFAYFWLRSAVSEI